MNLREALIKGARLSNNHRWLMYDDSFNTWNVYERLPYKKNTETIIETEDLEDAVIFLMNDTLYA